MAKPAFGSKPSVLRCSRCGKFVDWEDARLQIVCGCRPHVQLPPVDVREAVDDDRIGIASLFLRDFGPARVAALGVEFQDGSVPASLRSCLIFTAHAQRKKAQKGASTRTRIRRTTRMKAPGLRQSPAVRMKWRFFSIPAVAPQM